MEKIPSSENFDVRKRAVEALKNREQNAKEIFLEWRLAREAEVEILGTERASIRLLIESADVYAEADMSEEAWENLNDAHTYASQISDADLIREVEEKMNNLDELE